MSRFEGGPGRALVISGLGENAKRPRFLKYAPSVSKKGFTH